jgi:hypothetical protein
VRQNRVVSLPQGAGHIALQMEGFPIEFRNVWLEPLQAIDRRQTSSPATPKAAGAPRVPKR